MTPFGKALWYIESHFAEELTLDVVAAIAGVSRFHLTRAFGLATGMPLVKYLRGRRLTEAARALARGAPDILALALEAGYGSHEAFTRAFRDQFGVTPEAVRAQGDVNNLNLVEPIRMDETLLTTLEPPRFEDGRALRLAGLVERYGLEASAAIPAQWQRFAPHLGNVPGQVGRIAYGALFNSDDAGKVDYMTGVEVADFSNLPVTVTRLRIAAQRYAVFTHRQHISEIRRTWYTIWNKWLPQLASDEGIEALDAPDLERYGEEFDGRTGLGELEIWIPVKA
jgi:AraC family transcriptional regulator